MNSLDKMEDYDHLKQERDELAAQVEVMRGLINAVTYSDWSGIRCMDVNGVNWFDVKDKTLSITPSDALLEIQARALEDAADKLVGNACWCDMRLREMAAAKRKGE